MDHNAEFQALLDDVSRCFLTRQFEIWRARLVLPFSMVTRTGPVVLRTEEHLKYNFELYLQACDALQLDQVVRLPKMLERCPDGTWIGTYETNLLCHGQRATDPYVSSALLHEVNGQFLMSSILNARGHTDWTGVSPDREADQGGRNPA